jgi:hypothetical protein
MDAAVAHRAPKGACYVPSEASEGGRIRRFYCDNFHKSRSDNGGLKPEGLAVRK